MRQRHSSEQEWAWRSRAACRESDTELFYHPERERGAERRWREVAAKQVCATCPVREICLRSAIDTREQHGVWGGRTVEERETISRNAISRNAMSRSAMSRSAMSRDGRSRDRSA